MEIRHLDEGDGSVEFDTKREDYLAARAQVDDRAQSFKGLKGVQIELSVPSGHSHGGAREYGRRVED